MALTTPHPQVPRVRGASDLALVLLALLLVPACHRLGSRSSSSEVGYLGEAGKLALPASTAKAAGIPAMLDSGSVVNSHLRIPRLRRRHVVPAVSGGYLPRPGWNSIGANCEGEGPSLELAKEQTPAPGRLLRGRVSPIAVGSDIAAVLFIGAPLEDSSGAGLSLEVLGMPGCFLKVGPDLVTPLPVSSGSAKIRIQIPDNPLLGGCRFYLQAMVSAPGANAAQRILSDAVEVRLGHL